MSDLLGLSDEIAVQNKHARKSKVIKTTIIVLAILVTTAIVRAAIVSISPQKQSQRPQATYQYAALGKQCNEALARYNEKVNTANKAVEDISNQSASASQSITDQTQSYQSSQDAAYKKAYDDYTQLWKNGDITTDDYLAKVKALQPVADNITDSAATNTQAQSMLTNSTLVALHNAQNEALALTVEKDRLQDCVNMTTAKENVPATDVSAFEALITKSD